MATLELRPDEELVFSQTRFTDYWDGGECHTLVSVNDQPPREFVVELDEGGGHIDFLEGLPATPLEDDKIALAGIAALARMLRPDIATIEDPDGNLL